MHIYMQLHRGEHFGAMEENHITRPTYAIISCSPIIRHLFSFLVQLSNVCDKLSVCSDEDHSRRLPQSSAGETDSA